MGHLQPERFNGDGQRVPGIGGPLRQDVWRRLKEQRVRPLGAIGVGLSGAGAGQRPLDEHVQRDGRGLAGRLGGGAGRVGRGRVERLSPGRGRGYVGGGRGEGLVGLRGQQGRPRGALHPRRGRGRRRWGGRGGGGLGSLAGRRRVHGVALGDGGHPLGRGRRRAAGRRRHDDHAAAGLRELRWGKNNRKDQVRTLKCTRPAVCGVGSQSAAGGVSFIGKKQA